MAKVARAARVASRQRPESVSADKTIAQAEAGELYLIDASTAATNFTITLPTCEEGAYFTFLLVADSAANSQVLIDAGSGVTIKGTTVIMPAGTTASDAQHVVKANHSNRRLAFGDSAKIGDIVELVSDGSNWFIVKAEASVAFTTSI